MKLSIGKKLSGSYVILCVIVVLCGTTGLIMVNRVARSGDVVLDEKRRDAMRRVGLRDVEAFIAFQ